MRRNKKNITEGEQIKWREEKVTEEKKKND